MKHTRSSLPITILDRFVAAWSVGISLIIFIALRDYGFDDPYITYRYAANIANGSGLVYNAGERVLSTTAPLYALLLSIAELGGVAIPLASNFLSALSLGLGALALYVLGRMGGTPVAALVAALCYPLMPPLIFALGGEVTTMIALILWGGVAMQAGRPTVAGFLLGIATLVRADALLATLLLGGLCLVHHKAPMLLRFARSYLMTVAPFLIAAWIYFGNPLPITLGTKRSQAQIIGSQSFFDGLLAQLHNLTTLPLFWPLVGLSPVGLWVALRHRTPLAMVLLWGLLHSLAYIVLGVTAYFWYYGPSMLALVVATALGAEAVAHWLRSRVGAPIAGVVITILSLMVLSGQFGGLRWRATTPDPRLELYREVGQWLNTHTDPDARVGTLEVGIIGFYSERPIIDFAGLIQPVVATAFTPEAGYSAAAQWAIAAYQPDYLANQEAAFPLVQANPVLAAVCTTVASFPDPRFPTPFTIYRCEWPLGLEQSQEQVVETNRTPFR